MSTVMYRKTECLGCGFTQTTTTSYAKDKKEWNAIHTLAYCKSRKAHPVNQNRQSFDQLVITFGTPQMSVVRDSVDL